MTTVIDDDSTVSDSTQIDSASTTAYTTTGEDTIEVDTSSAAVTVTLATADADAGRTIRIVDAGGNAGTNNITINTGGSGVINPGSDSSKTIAVDGAGMVLESDGANWHSDRNRDLETVDITTGAVGDASVREFNSIQTVTEYSGSNLAAQLSNAISDAPEHAFFVIPPGSHTWGDSSITLDPNTLGNFRFLNLGEIDISGYTQTESPLLITPSVGTVEMRDEGQHPEIDLGIWFGTDSTSPSTDVLTVRDCFGVRVRQGFSFDHDGFTVAIENDSEFSENTAIRSVYSLDNDGAVDTRPASVTGGSGDESMRGTHIEDVWAGYPTTAGFRLRGKLYSSYVGDLHANLDGNIAAAGVSLGGDYAGSTMETWRVETLRNKAGSSDIGVEVTANYASAASERVFIRDLYLGSNVATPISNATGNPVFNTQPDGFYTWYKDDTAVWGLDANNGGSTGGGVGFFDLTGTTGSFDGLIRNHDGTGSGNPRGPAIWDNTNSNWISLIDGTTFT